MADNPAKRKCPSYDADNKTCTGETDIDLDSFSFTWTISNYSVLSDLTQIKSPTFYGGPKTKHSWNLNLQPKSKNKARNNVEYVALHLELVEYGNWLDGWKCTPIKTHFQLSILNADGQPDINLFPNKYTHNFTKVNKSRGSAVVIPSGEFINPARRLLVNDTLKIRCQVWIHGEMKEKVGFRKGRPSHRQRAKASRDRLVNDFGRMFNQSIASDVTVSTGETSFKAHKAVLAARSSVFAAMFTANMKKEEMATVQINDFDNEVVKGMLEYLYTGKTPAVVGRAQELLQISEKFSLEGLKEDCEYSIGDKLNKNNAAEMLVLAHTQKAPNLTSLVISFINSNKDELLKMKSFQDAMKAHAHLGLFADLLAAK